jgi:polysaccharide deacetylase family protein (PEP-CTERM system associated)
MDAASDKSRIVHAISIDVEDWYQSTMDCNAELSGRFEVSIHRLLEVFAQHQVHGTFFVLGLAAQKSPSLVRAISDAGHEIGSHGYSHKDVFTLTADHFRQDLIRAKGMLEDLVGKKVIGFRASNFSIDDRTMFAFDVLAETGHVYDSSVFPIKMPRYGTETFGEDPSVVTTPSGNRMIEAPIASCRWLGRKWPMGGGGYFRLWPYPVLRWAFRRMEKESRAGVIYFHPYECDTTEIQSYDDIPLKIRIKQGLGRNGFMSKINRLMTDFRVAPLREVLSELIHTFPIANVQTLTTSDPSPTR